MGANCTAVCVGTWSVEKTLLATWELSHLWAWALTTRIALDTHSNVNQA